MQKRRKYSEEYKREALAFADQPGVTLKQVGDELGIHAGLISRWRREFKAGGRSAFPGKGHSRDEEVTTLKRELARVKKERDFLREAATFFAKESK